MEHLLLCERGAEGSHGIGKAGLVKGNHVHIAFAQNHMVRACAARIVESVEISALIKELGLGGV